jgi:hypothetical protein
MPEKKKAEVKKAPTTKKPARRKGVKTPVDNTDEREKATG